MRESRHDSTNESSQRRVESAPGQSETYRDTRVAWDRIWRDEADYLRELRTLEYSRSRAKQRLFLPYLPREEWILEAGCGMGIEVVRLEQRGRRTVGVDYSLAALSEARAHQSNLRLALADIHELPFREGAFGAYLSFGVLEHFEFGAGPALREARRVLAERGVLVLTTPYPNLIWRLIRWKNQSKKQQTSSAPRIYETTYRADELVRVLEQAGFRVDHKCPLGHSFTLWGLGGPFRAPGYYRTTRLAEFLGKMLAILLPWSMCFETLVIARKCSTGIRR